MTFCLQWLIRINWLSDTVSPDTVVRLSILNLRYQFCVMLMLYELHFNHISVQYFVIMYGVMRSNRTDGGEVKHKLFCVGYKLSFSGFTVGWRTLSSGLHQQPRYESFLFVCKFMHLSLWKGCLTRLWAPRETCPHPVSPRTHAHTISLSSVMLLCLLSPPPRLVSSQTDYMCLIAKTPFMVIREEDGAGALLEVSGQTPPRVMDSLSVY